MANLNINSKSDAESKLNGFMDWEFNGDANYSDFCKFAANNADDSKYNTLDEAEHKSALMRDYLVSVNENPVNYSL